MSHCGRYRLVMNPTEFKIRTARFNRSGLYRLHPHHNIPIGYLLVKRLGQYIITQNQLPDWAWSLPRV